MKNVPFLKATIALGLLMSVAGIRAEVNFEGKIRTVNIQSLAMETAEGSLNVKQLQEASAKLEAEAKQLMAELQRIDDEVKKVRTEGAKKASVSGVQVAQADVEKKVRELEYKKGELQGRLQRLAQDGRNDLAMEEMRLMQPLYTSLVEIISQWAKEKDLYLVIDESSGRVIYKKEGLDATKDIMTLANKKYEQKVTLAKNKAAAPKTPATKVA